MKIHFLIYFILLLFVCDASQAQKISKDDRKAYRKRGTELKKEFKEYYKDPAKFVELKQDSISSKRKVDSLTTEILKLKAKNNASGEELEKLKKEEEESQARINELEKIKSQAKSKTIPQKGTFFALQLSQFKPQDLLKFMESQGNMPLNIEKDILGKEIYILGLYDNPAQAQELRRYVSQMGIRQTFVVVIKDGKLGKP